MSLACKDTMFFWLSFQSAQKQNEIHAAIEDDDYVRSDSVLLLLLSAIIMDVFDSNVS